MKLSVVILAALCVAGCEAIRQAKYDETAAKSIPSHETLRSNRQP